MKTNEKTVGHRAKWTEGTGVAVVREAIIPVVEDLKDFVRSTVKASEAVLRQDISSLRQDVSTLQVAVGAHSGLIKKVEADIQCVRTELKGEIQGVRTELKGEIQGVRTELKKEFHGGLAGLRTELKEEMHQMEHRLSDKIDGHAARFDDHEARIKAIERVA